MIIRPAEQHLQVSRHLTPNGSVIVPPRIARWLETKAKVTADWRISLRGTDFEAYEVMLALHLSTLRFRLRNESHCRTG